MQKILELKKISIGFNHILFADIDAELVSGKLTALLGINGIGKSCLLKTIGRLVPPFSGEIILNGKSQMSYSDLEYAQNVAMVLTEKIYIEYLRVDELLAMGRSPFTNWKDELSFGDQEKINEIIQLIGLEKIKNKYFTELSDGQKQKVMIARALAQEPKLLILDEPTTYLDIPSKIELLTVLKKIAAEKNISILWSTHDLEFIRKKIDTIWFMGSDGQFHIENPETLISSGLLQKYFNI